MKDDPKIEEDVIEFVQILKQIGSTATRAGRNGDPIPDGITAKEQVQAWLDTYGDTPNETVQKLMEIIEKMTYDAYEQGRREALKDGKH